MAKKITNDSFIDSNFLQPTIDKVKEFIAVIGELKDKLKEVGKESTKSLEGLNPSENVKDAQKLNEVLEKLLKTEEQLIKLQVEEAKGKEKVKKLQEDQVAILEKQAKATVKSNEELKKKLELARKELKTIADLKERNKLLAKELENVNITTKEGIKQYSRIANEIEDNKQKVKELTDSIKKERKERELQELAIKAEQETLQGLIKTQVQAREANKALRASVQNLDTETQKERIEELNALIDQNSKLIEDNADAFTQSKINIGRYTESINKAFEGNAEFEKIQNSINIVLAISERLFKKDEKTVDKNTKSRENLTEANKKLEESSEDVNKSLRNNIIGVIITGFTTILGLFSQTEEGATDLKVAFAQIEVTIRLLFERAKAFSLVVVDSFKKAGKGIQVFGLEVKKAFNFLGDNTETDAKIKALEDEILSLDKAIDENLNRTTADFTETLLKNIEATEKLTLLEIAFEKNLANVEKRLVSLRGQEEKAKALRDSDTDSLEERNAQGLKAIKIAEEIGRTEIALSQARVKLAEDRLRIELETAGITNATAEQIRNLTNLDALRGKVRPETLQAQTDALLELGNAENEFTANVIENNEQLALIRRDIFERNLDDQIDYFDNVKVINERIIADETATLEAKVKAQEVIRIEGEKTFKRQIELIAENKKVDLEFQIARLKATGGTIAQIQAKEKELATFKIDSERILAIENAQEFNEEVRRLKLSEIAENRSLEVFRERRLVKQDEKDIEKDLFEQKVQELKLDEDLLIVEKELAELQKNTTEIQRIGQIKNLEERKKAIEDFNESQGKIELEAEQERLEKEIELLQKEIDERIKLGQEGSQKVKELQLEQAEKEVELNRKKLDAIKADNDKALKEQEDSEKKSLEKRKELFETGVKIFENFLRKNNEERLKKLDKEISAIEERQSTLRNLAENGNEEAVKSLAESEKQEAKIRQEKEKELKRQQRIEAGLAAFKLLAAKAEKDPKTALPETLAEILTLSSFVNALPGFYKGTENIGESMGKPHLNTSKDAYLSMVDGMGLARLDGGERIMTTEQNKALGGISNEELTKLAIESKRPISDFKRFENVQKNNTVIVDNSKLVGLMQETNDILKRLPSKMAKTTDVFDNKTGVLTQIVEYANTTERTHKKLFITNRKK